MRPPTSPYLIERLFGLPFLSVRWYGVLIMGGALLAALLAARRAQARGIDPEHVWNQLMLGLLLAIPLARAYYVLFEWPRYVGRPVRGPRGPLGRLEACVVTPERGAITAVLARPRWPWSRRPLRYYVEQIDLSDAQGLLVRPGTPIEGD